MVFPSSDGLVRRVRVRTSQREYDRDRSMIIFLEATDNEQSDHSDTENIDCILASLFRDS